ncbi:5963_t:CDS:1 [Cetraspora pellucida]|uniref:5963_t:CDS:1 n=1 Tax=Cetraspora pellucida TaxID=1433469 RepID=A0A9N9P9W3_9GLOM|nr:5963_t:CDS:1 [Cetraspora pellucida]
MTIEDSQNYLEYNLNKHLHLASKALAEEIQKQHYKKFLYWPTEIETQESDVEILINSAYKSGNNFYIIWSCIGWIKVKDYVSSKNKYNASFEEKPDIKLVIFNFKKLQPLENSAQKNYEKALESLGNTKKLNWNKF